jgi:hypothetical protein
MIHKASKKVEKETIKKWHKKQERMKKHALLLL